MTVINLDTSIILTLGYTAQFGQPLSTAELYRRLIEPREDRVSLSQLAQALKVLVKQKLVIKDQNLYTLWGFEDNFVKYPKKFEQSQVYWQQTPKLVQFLKKIPWITGVAVTGSLAVNGSRQKDDIDLMIIAQPNRLWLSRILVTFYTIIIGKKKGRGIIGGTGWCFNLWLDESCLGLPNQKRSLYSAYELTQAVWLFASKTILKKIVIKNRWFLRFTPFNQLTLSKTEIFETKSQDSLSQLFCWLFDWLNTILYFLQKSYMGQHQTTELVNLHSAFFHPLNTKGRIYQAWQKTLKNWSGKIFST